MSPSDKPLVHLVAALLTTPPMGEDARREVGFRLRDVQAGRLLSMPLSRPMPSIGKRVHELRVDDIEMKVTWRVIYRIDDNAIVVVDAFKKKTEKTAKMDLERSKKRLAAYDE